MNCRICGSHNVNKIGEVEYYSDFAWPVFDCGECKARFTWHDASIYDVLHREAGSCYNLYRGLLERCAEIFRARDLDALKGELSQASKYKFIIEEIEHGPCDARLLEIGCSRGYLTSYFILAGYQITGVDVSDSAVKSAKAVFGDHFVLDGDRSIVERAPYDVVYHVGTIGCVADPLGLTRRLLDLLKPGGHLLFNAPNLQTCCLRGQLWIDAAPPPDLVSIFPLGFWKRQFAKEAEVEETIETCDPHNAVAIGLRKAFGRRWRRPIPIALDKSSGRYLGAGGEANGQPRLIGDFAWQNFERSVSKICRETGLSQMFPAQPTDFGLFVKMTRLADNVGSTEQL
jgi:2-polyprenyl-3-methyl-5-hydroxy-6-metoxy-1,4-benzoquinol methylase